MSVDLAAGGVAAPTPGPRAELARAAVMRALEGCDDAFAAWEAGSAAFGRADLDSDLDVGVICVDGGGTRVLDAIEVELRAVDTGLDVWDVGASPFGVQRFWQPRARDASLCMVDVSVMGRDEDADKYRELLLPERHGGALTMYDPDGVLAAARASATFDAAAHRVRIADELQRIRERRALFGSFAAKELARGRDIDAHGMYQRMVVDPLIALLGMQHRPLRFDFARRYLHEELPEGVVECLVGLVEPSGPEALGRAIDAGLDWTDALLAKLDPDALPIEEHAAQMRAAFGD